jgi:uncharacterized protein YbjQ (UPF0145 family)
MVNKCKLCKAEEEQPRLGFWDAVGLGDEKSFITIKDETYCRSCGEGYIKSLLNEIYMTTTHSIDGYKVKKYIDIQSVEIVIGTGMFSEFTSGIADFFGDRSTAFEKKLQDAKKTALDKLKYRAFERDGNAVIGIDLDYTEFSGNRIGLIANGTIVEIEAIR